jgi:hypothetical protein
MAEQSSPASRHRHRIRRIQRTVVTASVAVFLLVWLLVAVQMAGGHDPALASSTHRPARVAQPPEDSFPADPAPDQPAPYDPAPAPLTTQQS